MMKKIILGLILCFAPTLLFAETLKIYIPGMVCPLCLVGVQKQFKKDVADPKNDIVFDLESKIVTIVNTNKILSDKEINKKIKRSGYEAKSIERLSDQKEKPQNNTIIESNLSLDKAEQIKK